MDEEHKKEIAEEPATGDSSGQERRDEGMFEIPLIGVRVPRPILPWLVVSLFATLLLGWSFLTSLPAVWFEDEGYYSHGLLIPFMAAAAIFMRREKMRKEPVGSSWIGLAVMVLGVLLLLDARAINNISLAGAGFIFALIGGIYYAFGKRIGRHCVGPVLFLVFMMPALGWIIDSTTNRLQIISTAVAGKLLGMVGYLTEIAPSMPTTIHMNTYVLNVGGPCSGFKLILALAAFTTYFVMVSSLGLWRNLALYALMLPLALFVNGLRIMLIGIVGESPDGFFGNWLRQYGDDPGLVFHDYSGYLTLFVCFFILFYIVRLLEGKRTDAVEN